MLSYLTTFCKPYLKPLKSTSCGAWWRSNGSGGSIHAPKKRSQIKSKKRDYSENEKQRSFDFPDTSKNLS